MLKVMLDIFFNYRPVKLEEFDEYITKHKKDSDLLFSEDYQVWEVMSKLGF